MGIRSWTTLAETVAEGREDEFYLLWIAATAAYGVGDVVTTVALVWYSPTVAEGNPLVRYAIESFGLAGLVGVKLLAFAVCLGVSLYGARAWQDRLTYYAPPLALLVIGTFLTVFNVRLMAG